MLEGRGGGWGRWGGAGGGGSEEVGREVEKGRWRRLGESIRDKALARFLVFMTAVVGAWMSWRGISKPCSLMHDIPARLAR